MSDNNDDPLDSRVWPMKGAREEVSLPEGSERAVELPPLPEEWIERDDLGVDQRRGAVA